MIEYITIDRLLPVVFREEKEESRIAGSEVWLKHLDIAKPQSYLVYAESGTGKSSLCAYLYGNRRDYDGKILFDGEDVGTYTPEKWSRLRREALAYLPQQLSLFPELTAIDNVLLKNRLTDYSSEADIRLMFQQLAIDNRADVEAGRLSIGQQQRVAIIRALVQPFDFLLLDEPVSHLDARNNEVVAQMIAAEARKRGASIIATSVGNHLSISDFKMLRL
ncbi:MAG: ATP-binding cassette domain-containing protein [Bacteroidales bacterium]|nr:ATP-binding cassette domain-containing protein [Bacteroidales bacterium]